MTVPTMRVTPVRDDDPPVVCAACGRATYRQGGHTAPLTQQDMVTVNIGALVFPLCRDCAAGLGFAMNEWVGN